MLYEFNIPISPIAKGRPRFDSRTRRSYTPEKTRSAETNLKFFLARQWGSKPPLEGPLELAIVLSYIRPKSVTEKKRPFLITRPDLDNLAKTIMDSGNKLIWRDDSLIFSLRVLKQYADTESIFFTVREFE